MEGMWGGGIHVQRVIDYQYICSCLCVVTTEYYIFYISVREKFKIRHMGKRRHAVIFSSETRLFSWMQQPTLSANNLEWTPQRVRSKESGKNRRRAWVRVPSQSYSGNKHAHR